MDKASELVDKAIDLEPNVLFDKAQHTIKSIDHVKKKLEDQVRLFINVRKLFVEIFYTMLVVTGSIFR